MADYKFPTNIAFRKKAAFIADKVLYAINLKNPISIGIEDKDFCPLGCITKNANQRPKLHFPSTLDVFKNAKGILSKDDISKFISGFDSWFLWAAASQSGYFEHPMYQLGRAYRKHFSK